jgi:hypothetical protein
LGSATERLLRTPASGSQQVAHVIEVILDAELATDDLGHASRRPDLTSKAERLSTAGQQHRHLGELLERQSRRRARGRTVSECRYATFSAAAYPLTHSALGYPKRPRNGTLLPALLLQFPCA